MRNLFPDLASKLKLYIFTQQEDLKKRIIKHDSFEALISCESSFCHKLIEDFLTKTKQWSNERALKHFLSWFFSCFLLTTSSHNLYTMNSGRLFHSLGWWCEEEGIVWNVSKKKFDAGKKTKVSRAILERYFPLKIIYSWSYCPPWKIALQASPQLPFQAQVII